MRALLVAAVAITTLAGGRSLSAQPALDDLIDRASRYVVGYERAFWLLAMDEEYVQWLERPTNPGSNLTRGNPGGGMVAGRQESRRVAKADFVLVQAGPGRGWLPFRDILTMNGSEVTFAEDRLVRLLRSGTADAFDLAADMHEASRKHDVGNVTRTINIPMLGMMLLHPDVRERFTFKHEGDESIGGREVERIGYRETTRPTLIKTTRGRDLVLTGRMWIESSTGVVVKTEMIAADPVVRAQVTVTFRRDGELAMWVPEKMEEYYKASLAFDDIYSTSTFTMPRVFQPGGRY
ncbi:MAG: hypothetical protein IT177_11570 [Acidobacteria bacterium]|nr:hypothetical protein [Acidobacteriota bacterium]